MGLARGGKVFGYFQQLIGWVPQMIHHNHRVDTPNNRNVINLTFHWGFVTLMVPRLPLLRMDKICVYYPLVQT